MSSARRPDPGRVNNAAMTFRAAVAVVLLVLGGAPVLALAAPPAYACSCAVEATGPAALAAAEVVFEGRPVERQGEGSWTFQVDRVYRGAVAGRQRVVTGTEQEASCGRSFTLGRTYLVDGRATPGDPGAVGTGLCTATRDVAGETPAERRDLLHVLGTGSPAPAAGPPSPAPGPEQRSAPVAVVVAGLVLAVATVVTAAVRSRRRRD